jgi:hypothetical protein
LMDMHEFIFRHNSHQRNIVESKKFLRHITLIRMNSRLFWIYLKLIRVQSIYTMTPMYHMYKDRHMEKFMRVMRHIKLISINRRLFWMHYELHEVDQAAFQSMYTMTPMYICSENRTV